MTNVIVGVAFAVGLFLFFAGIDGMRKGSAGKPISWRDRMDGMFQSTEQWGAQLRAASPRAGKLTLAEKLSRADLKLRTSEWMLIRIGVLVALGLVTLLWRGISPHFVIAVAVGWFAPGVYLRWRQSRRLKAFNDQLGDTLVMMSNALKSGYSMAQALDVVANRASAPISQEFDRVVKEVNLGAGIEESLARLVRRTESADLDMVATAIAINRKIGGNLSEILEAISETIRERVRIKGEMRTMTAQARGSGYMITGLPIVLGVFMYFVTPQYFAPMVSNPIGIGLLVFAGIFLGLGQFIMSRIAQVEV
ncbi:MAG: secretion system protein [Chloroflexi bacterium]|nr:MAG: secretion system protein [Chloroflexota bacterium]